MDYERWSKFTDEEKRKYNSLGPIDRIAFMSQAEKDELKVMEEEEPVSYFGQVILCLIAIPAVILFAPVVIPMAILILIGRLFFRY